MSEPSVERHEILTPALQQKLT